MSGDRKYKMNDQAILPHSNVNWTKKGKVTQTTKFLIAIFNA